MVDDIGGVPVLHQWYWRGISDRRPGQHGDGEAKRTEGVHGDNLLLRSPRVQDGRVQLYVLYIAIALLVLLVWKLG